MNFNQFFKQYGVSVVAASVLIGGIWWGIDGFFNWHTGAQSSYAEMHEFIHQSDDIPFQDGKLSDAQIAARDNVVEPVKGPKGAIAWKDLSKSKLNFTMKDGQQTPAPYFTKEASAWNGKTAEIKGYIFPLDQSGKQKHFLLSPYPPSCPYCLPSGPSELIDVMMKDPIKFTYDSILIKGVFETVTDDRIKQGMLYAIHDADLEE